jgi:type 1 fimbria pilin
MAMGLPMAARANCASSNVNISSANNPTLTGPADHNSVGQQIGGWGGVTSLQYVFDMTWLAGMGNGCNSLSAGANFAYAGSMGTPTAVKYVDSTNGKSYDVYATGVPGIGYAVGIRDFNATNSMLEVPLNAGTNQTYPFQSGQGAVASIGYQIRVLFIATGRLQAGSYTIPSMQLAKLWVQNTSGYAVPPPSYAILNPTTITVAATGCNVTTPASQIIPMPTVGIGTSDLKAPGSQASFNVAVKCDAGVTVYATMTDVTNPANTGNVLQLAPASTASGVGIQLFKNGDSTPVAFGPDSSSAGNINQWFVGGSVGAAQNAAYSIPFRAKYVQTSSKVKGGTVEAVATITFSYQ